MKAWWTGEPIFKEEDGQNIIHTFSRKVKEKWEYAIVTRYDDGTFISAKILSNGKIKVIETEEEFED